ncbi:calmodulin-like protein 2 [Cryptomeria japonica]|uniref:calmodulin-like protein 2 n=1 Tax=Cryptomeria japonica TaxID=3369 RepID=UPI0027DA2388|nr:calmodulin-like protein 2 [Cryptomeria japonica]
MQMAFSSVPEEISKMFYSLDENGDGRLSGHEIICFLNKLGISLSKRELKCLGMSTSQNEDGSLSFDEFVVLYQSVMGESSKNISNKELDDELKEAFKIYDTTEDGYISCAELQQVLCRLGLMEKGGHCVEECQKMICRYDLNSDGLIDFSEFKSMMTKMTSSSA